MQRVRRRTSIGTGGLAVVFRHRAKLLRRLLGCFTALHHGKGGGNASTDASDEDSFTASAPETVWRDST